jgi:NAD(P)-dependent dehydrogenase (short-subunit alcohol dehydrogenase family)
VGANPVIVGGGSGIGAALADLYWSAGRAPIVWDVAGTFDIKCDIEDPAAIDAALAETIERSGVPNEVTITAGIGHGAMLLDVSPEEWDRVLSINTRGPMLVMRAVARALIDAQAKGSIVATSSVSARLVDRGMATYCASKAALSMVVHVAACEWGTHGIRVNAVGPGVTVTPMLGPDPSTDHGYLKGVVERTALGRLGQPSDVAEAILALHALDWITGQVVECDGGLGQHSPIDSYGETMRELAP